MKSNPFRKRILPAAALALAFVPSVALAGRFELITYDFDGAVATIVNGINSSGDLVGEYVDPAGHVHGFSLIDGEASTIDIPGALMTEARGINSRGDIVGSYNEDFTIPGFGFRGFLLRKGASEATRIDFPGHLNTILQRITPNGTIVGCYHDEGTDVPPLLTMHGIRIDGDDYESDPLATSMYKAASPGGEVLLGEFWDFDMNTERGYLQYGDSFIPFDVPGMMFTMPWDMNASGVIVGMSMDESGTMHGFVGTVEALDVWDVSGSTSTTIFGINNRGDFVGSYIRDGMTHGFVARKGYRRNDAKE